MTQNFDRTSRRHFLSRAASLGGLGIAAPWAANLATLSDAMAQSSNDYRAVVCLYMHGGNDHYNTVLPLDDANWAEYKKLRNEIALDRQGRTQAGNSYNLQDTRLFSDKPWAGGRQMALHPSMQSLMPLFNNGKLALAMNVGTLKQPTDRLMFKAGTQIPNKLFSHNDQTSTWQAGAAEGARFGWAGRMGDWAMDKAMNGSQSQFTAISVNGNAVLMNGQAVRQYQLGVGGATPIKARRELGSASAEQLMKSFLSRTDARHELEAAYADVAKRSIDTEVSLNAALAKAQPMTTGFDMNNPLAAQLAMVARMIQARSTLGLKRQVFFVSMGGFDLHDNLLPQHEVLLQRVADAMRVFYDETVALGVADKVTTFTASEFGRTLSSNGDGSDHGWGSYHFVMGGAVKGRTHVGELPAYALDSGLSVGSGRLIPQISVQRYGAEMARFMGITNDTELGKVFSDFGAADRASLGLFHGL